LADGRQVLIDFGNQGNPADSNDARCDLAAELRADLRKARRNYFDVSALPHLDADHCQGASDFSGSGHAAKYQGEDRIKIERNVGGRPLLSRRMAWRIAPA